MEAVLVVLLVVLGLIAFVIGRSWTLLLPFVAVPAFYLGLDQKWWGHGVGDRWQVAAVGVLALAVGVAGAGLILRRLVMSDSGMSRDSP